MSTSISTEIKKIGSNELVSVSIIPWMRSIKIYFRALGLRPNTRHFPFFDGVLVSDWCREEAYSNVATDPTEYGNLYDNATAHPEGSSTLFSDTEGKIEGSFFVPSTSALKFGTGSREFKLLDISVDDNDEAISIASTLFVATGDMRNVQDTYVKTRVITTTITQYVDVGGGGSYQHQNEKDTKYAYGPEPPDNSWRAAGPPETWTKD
jgi:hypothetical protein